MEKLESGQQEIQEKIAQMTKMVTSLTKEKWIIDDPSLQRESTFWKDGIDPPIVSNPDNHGKQEELRKNLFGQSKHINM